MFSGNGQVLTWARMARSIHLIDSTGAVNKPQRKCKS
nr:MAG TPA: hypothetical protein [Caudoviricetes sp.]